MKKHVIPIFLVLVLSLAIVGAMKVHVSADVVKSNGHATVSIPEHAVELAPGVFSLGSSVVDGRKAQGIMFVDYVESHKKPGTECGNGICEPGENANKCPSDCSEGNGGSGSDTSGCYEFLAKGAKWKTVEPWVMNPSNNPPNNNSLNENFAFANMGSNIGKWESAAGTDILGSGSSTNSVLVADTVNPDGVNEVYFADISSPGAIGVTIVWGFFNGPPPFRELIEWDQIYDDADFNWSDSGALDSMDFESISTHELGHSVGLGDLYTDLCVNMTMYGFGSPGETHTRTLEDGDINGIQKLYS